MSLLSRPMLAALTTLALAGCGKGDAAGGLGGRDGPAPSVVVTTVKPMIFADRIEAVGTAYAKEATTLTSTVTERITKLNFRDGEYVNQGAVIAELARSEEAADLREVRARLTEAEQRLDRLRALQRRGFATNAAVDEQVAARDAARAQAGAVEAQIGDRVIRAPFSGVLGLRRISPGATVTSGTTIATLSDLSSIKLDFSLPETFLGAVKVGQAIEARAAAYPDDLFAGRIEGIEPIVDPVTRSVVVRAVLPNADRRLRPGMLLTVAIISNLRQSLGVPELALVAQRDRTYAFKVDAQNTALRVPVEIGPRQEGMVEIRRGLRAGDQVVAEGTVKVRDGGKVKPIRGGTSAAGGRGQAASRAG